MRIATHLDDLERHLEERKKNFVLERVSLPRAKGWAIERGVLRHQTGGFFSVVGADVGDFGDKVFLYQPQSAITGLLTSFFAGQSHLLLQARAEPGTEGTAQYAPTIQSTLANYLGLHGGQPAAYTDHFIRHHPTLRRVVHDSEQLDLGERYLFKAKRSAILEVDPGVELADGFIWVPQALLHCAVKRPYFLNTDLRALLGVFPWAAGPGVESALTPPCELVSASLARPVDPRVIGAICARLSGRAMSCNFKDLNQLENWDIGPDGLFERESRQGFSIEFFYCEASGREVRSWFQPLLNSHGSGYAALYCREARDTLEVLVRAGSESGLKTGQALLPTVLHYPDRTDSVPPAPGKVLVSTMESDEGGRFLSDTSSYELVLVPPDFQGGDGTFWVNVAELKWFLSHSNLCSIQLRGLSSMLLGKLPC
jgi:oxidase EvaA